MRLVVTGMGVISPVGNGVPAFWQALCDGKSGIHPIAGFDTKDLPYSRGGEVKDIPATRGMAFPGACDNGTRFMAAAAAEAAADAGLTSAPELHPDFGIVLGSNFGGTAPVERLMGFTTGRLPRPGSDSLTEFSFMRCADYVALLLGSRGPRVVLSLSCSSGTAALAHAASLIREGHAAWVLAGGYDSLSRFAFAGLSALRTMTKDEIRPFDKRREGTLFSEGAGAVILERLDHALARGARIHAEFLGGAMNNNAFHMTAPDKNGEGTAAVMRAAIEDAGIQPDAVDHVNAHGTGTKYNDVVETQAVKAVFGQRAGRIPINAIKSMTGHMMGAAGSVEAIASVMTIRDGVIPPTINYGEPDPECDLDYVPNVARKSPVQVVLSNSAGIGGNNAAVVFAAYQSGGGK